MLEYSEDGYAYIITETLNGGSGDETKTVSRYSKDLTVIQTRNEPGRDTTKLERDWFEAYFRKHFDEKNYKEGAREEMEARIINLIEDF